MTLQRILVLQLLFTIKLTAQFGPPQYVDLSTESGGLKQHIRTADLDNDGLSEIIVGSDFSNVVRVFWNNGGLTFSAATNVPAVWQNLSAVEPGDIDGNGFIDLMSLDANTDILSWHPNNDDTFAPAVVIDTELDIVFGRILYAEFTGDGINDIIVIAHNDALLYKNNGDGSFQPRLSLIPDEQQTEFYTADYGDFNNDGFMDFMITANGFRIYQNDGFGNFSLTATADFGTSFLTCSADYDDDGFTDVVMKTNQLKFFHNTQSDAFETPVVLETENGNNRALRAADLDNDGDADLLTATNQLNSVYWYQNDGTGNFEAQNIIHSDAGNGGFYDVHAADLDNDGDLEPIWVTSFGVVGLHENLSSLGVGTTDRNPLVIYPNPTNEVLSISIENQPINSVKIYNLLGQLVLYEVIDAAALTLDVSALLSGQYLIEISSGKKIFSQPFIKL